MPLRTLNSARARWILTIPHKAFRRRGSSNGAWCRAEIECFGLWQEDEEDFEDICDAIWEKVAAITEEIEDDQAMSWALNNQELGECVDLARDLLASERYLSGTDLDFLYDVVSGEIFDTRRLQEIAVSHGRWFKI